MLRMTTIWVQPCVIALLDSDMVRITRESRMICGSLGFCALIPLIVFPTWHSFLASQYCF